MIARLLIAVLMMGACAVGFAEQEESAQEEKTEQTEQQADPLGDLDDLLGIEGDGADEDGEADALDTNKAELERELTNEQIGEQFIQAIKQMEEAADRLQKGRDAGVVTQRLQDEILVKLDILIDAAEQQGGQSGSSSSGSNSDSSEQPPQEQQQQQGQEEGQQSESDASAGEGGGNPSYQEGRNDLIEAVGAGWGALPERVRDTLLEGLNDVFSSRYKEQTEAYYRRLAEEGGPE